MSYNPVNIVIYLDRKSNHANCFTLTTAIFVFNGLSCYAINISLIINSGIIIYA